MVPDPGIAAGKELFCFVVFYFFSVEYGTFGGHRGSLYKINALIQPLLASHFGQLVPTLVAIKYVKMSAQRKMTFPKKTPFSSTKQLGRNTASIIGSHSERISDARGHCRYPLVMSK